MAKGEINVKIEVIESEIENQRRQLWCDIYVAYVGASNTINNDGAYKWADIALQRFDERFSKHK